MFAKLEGLEKKYLELEEALAQPDVFNDQDHYRKLTKAHADLRAKSEEAEALKIELARAREQREEAQRLLGEARVALTDMRSRADEERKASAEKLALLQEARTQLSDQFKALAADILEEKSKSFSEANRASLGTLIGVLPGYDSIGVWAPILLCLLRFGQRPFHKIVVGKKFHRSAKV